MDGENSMDGETRCFYEKYNANDARKTAERSMMKLTPARVKLLDSIISASKSGKTEMTYKYNLCDDSTIEFLEEKSFKVKFITAPRNGDYLIISW